MTLGEIIKTYRAEHEYSQEEFARRTGLSKAYISILERNRNPINNKPVVPSLDTIKSVAFVIGIDFNDLIAMVDGDQPINLQATQSSPDTITNPTNRKSPSNNNPSPIQQIFDSLNEEGQDKLIEYGNDLAALPKYKKCDMAAQENIG